MREELRALLEEQWPPAFRNDLARAYINRGSAQAGNNALAEAIADYDRAIVLHEELRALLKEQWPPAFRNHLAMAYRNRAGAWLQAGDEDAAARDNARADELTDAAPEAPPS